MFLFFSNLPQLIVGSQSHSVSLYLISSKEMVTRKNSEPLNSLMLALWPLKRGKELVRRQTLDEWWMKTMNAM